jgi:alpha-L-fucosidase 2
MSKNLTFFFLFILYFSAGISQPASQNNIWTKPPSHIPSQFSVDAPLMGNGDVTMSLGYVPNRLRYYLSKNDFWRMESQADKLSGPRIVAFVDINLNEFPDNGFYAEQNLGDGITTCMFSGKRLQVKSWVSATGNIIFIELEAGNSSVDISVNLTGPYNHKAILRTGKENNITWLTRSFVENADIPSEVAVALKIIDKNTENFILGAREKVLIAVAVESRFKTENPLQTVINRCIDTDKRQKDILLQKHKLWWADYWNKSSIAVSDTVLMKAYYQGLYTMAACSRDINFPPGIFGWNTSDEPGWNGDYHLNYNHFAPYYALYGANRIEQGIPQDAPLLDFISRGEWYAQNVTKTRGILYPVGIGPRGIEPTRNFPNENGLKSGNIEEGGLFWQQRSNSAYGLVNMAQCWRLTYDKEYGQKIYPYVIGVVNFWEDYLKYENGRYIIYSDAIHEGSGENKNPILTLGLLRNAFELAIDLSNELNVDRKRQIKWKDILNKLSAFPTQERNGKKVFRYTEDGAAWWDSNGLGIQHIYPSNAITLASNEELLMVARNTIADMKRWQDFNTSNSFFMAAIRVGYDPDIIFKELHNYALHTYPNGFQLNNPHGIENACTVANALTEMLCMSAGNVIRLFSVFPKNENAGFVNIRAWGAFLVSARLNNGVISDVIIVSEKGRKCTLINPWQNKKVLLYRNGEKAETLTGDKLNFKTSTGETIELKNMEI